MVQIGQCGEFGRITSPTYFISDIKVKEMLIGIITAMQVPQALGVFKSETKFFFDVGGFHLAPSMTIILVVHALHLSRMANWKMDGQQFKDDVVIENDVKKGNIFDFDRVVV
jgi:hypothetical protein